MLEIILGCSLLIELFITIGFAIYIALKSDNEDKDRNTFILTSLGNFIRKLFMDKNLFGIILGLITFVLIIPAMLLLLLLETIMWLIVLVVAIYDLGNKNIQ